MSSKKLKRLKGDQVCLNFQKNNTGIYQCMGRIQGQYSLYILWRSILAERIVHKAHKRTMHEGVILTMTVVRENY